MKLQKILFFLVLLLFINNSLTAEDYTPGNFGKLEDASRLGHICGNGMRWDYTLIFKLKRKEEYRALSDIEESITSNDKLVAMGAYDNCVIASIRTDSGKQGLYSRYARASKLTSLCKVYSFKWTESKEWSDIIGFSEKRLSSICR